VKNKLEEIKESENVGEVQEPIRKNKNLAGSDIQNEADAKVSNNEEGSVEEKEQSGEEKEQSEEEAEENIFSDMDMSAEELAILAQVRKEEIENSKNVILDHGPVIVKPDLRKVKWGIERETQGGDIVIKDEYPVIQRHPQLGDMQKVLSLSKRASGKWQDRMAQSQKAWWKVAKKGTGFDTKYRFDPIGAD
jgi:hypothetical protein